MRTLAGCALLVGVLGFGAMGCGGRSLQVTHVRTAPPLGAKPASLAIPVFFNERPGRPYRELAQIRVRAKGRSANIDEVLSAAVEDARSLGADAVIVDLRAHYDSVPVTVDCEGRPNVPPTKRLNARATAIVFVADEHPEKVPSGPAPRPGCLR